MPLTKALYVLALLRIPVETAPKEGSEFPLCSSIGFLSDDPGEGGRGGGGGGGDNTCSSARDFADELDE